MRAPVDHIAAPPFPRGLPWINSEPLGMDEQVGWPVLVEFWDFCRPNSIRTTPYIKKWYERYAEHGADGSAHRGQDGHAARGDDGSAHRGQDGHAARGDDGSAQRGQDGHAERGLRVIGVHAAGFEPSSDPEAVRAAVTRLGIRYPVVVDTELEIWGRYGNLGWPARYLFDRRGMLFERHFGEGAYQETERAIQELLGVEEPLVEPIRPEDAPGAVLEPQSEDVEGPYSGPYRAGGVWAVLAGAGEVTVNGRTLTVDGPGAYELIAHDRSTSGELALVVGAGVHCHAVCFTPGLASRGI